MRSAARKTGISKLSFPLNYTKQSDYSIKKFVSFRNISIDLFFTHKQLRECFMLKKRTNYL